MDYFLYSGCSLEASGSHYMISLEAVASALGIKFREIKDWNCCGASISYIGASELQSLTLNARNLALAEAQGGYDIIAPCSSCYIMMNKTNHYLSEDPNLLTTINNILAEGGLKYSGKLRTRHLLDVLYNDIGLEKIKATVKKMLKNLKVVAYYGCQTTRPYGEYDSKENPYIQDEILKALGAEAIEYDKRINCCGSGIFLTEMEFCSYLVKDIIENAKNHGAQIVSTACPMCQMNLEIYQPRINKITGANLNMPIVFITQLIAAAFGLEQSSAFDHNIVPVQPVLRNIGL